MKGIATICLATTMVITSAGCRTYPLTDAPPTPTTGSHTIMRPYIPDLNESGLFHLSCTDRYPNGTSVYAAFDRDAQTPLSRSALARRHFLHAAMASNTYRSPRDRPIFVIPGWQLVRPQQSRSGLLIDVYGNGPDVANSTQLIVAYRGTDGPSLLDWRNNLAFREPPQYRESYAHLKALRDENRSASITATGHSLGGGIALNMSLRFDGVDAVGFNPSPRIHFGNTSRARHNYRASIYEVGEMLDVVSGPWTRLRLPSDTAYGNYNFLDYRVMSFSPLPEHGIYELARGLILVAMTRGDADARRLFTANINRDEALQKDPEHCRAWFP
ncbi:MAG: Mbeg1-like protein [Lysobacteraceae bacterium]